MRRIALLPSCNSRGWRTAKADELEGMVNRASLFGLAAGGILLAATAVQAQPASGVDWSGPYIGVNGGYNWGSTTSHGGSTTVNQLSGVDAGAGPVAVPATTFPSGRIREDGAGFMGGGQLGMNVQAGGLVWGVEGDFDGVSGGAGQTRVYSLAPTALTTGSTVIAHTRSDPQWIATVRGRLGLAVNRMLIYGTGGVAFANLRERASYAYAPTVTSAVTTANPGVTYGPYANGGGDWSGTHTGWTAGAGVEFMAAPNLTLGAEYRHTEIGAYGHGGGSGAPNGVYERTRLGFTDDAVLARVNLKFSGLHGMF